MSDFNQNPFDLVDFQDVDFSAQFADYDPNADLTSQPPPPEDGVYRATITVKAPEKTDVRGGYDFAKRPIRPKYEGGQLKTDPQGRINGTLYTQVKIFDADGTVVSVSSEYVFTYVGRNGTSPALSLARGMGIDVSSPAAVGEFIKAHVESGQADPFLATFGRGAALTNLLLLDGLRALIESKGEDGYELPAVQIQTVLEAPNGKKRGEYDEMDVKIKGSAKLAENGHWPQPDETKIPGARLKTNVISFSPSN